MPHSGGCLIRFPSDVQRRRRRSSQGIVNFYSLNIGVKFLSETVFDGGTTNQEILSTLLNQKQKQKGGGGGEGGEAHTVVE